jgi:hypothetical protein
VHFGSTAEVSARCVFRGMVVLQSQRKSVRAIASYSRGCSLSVARLYSVKLQDDGEDLEGSRHVLIEVLYQNFPGGTEENLENPE